MTSRDRALTRGRRARTATPAFVLLLVVLAAWFVGSAVLGRTLLPGPGAVVGALVELSGTGDLWPATGWTARVAGLGIAVAVIVAIPLAWGVVHSRSAAAALEPYLVLSQAVPAVALAPLLVLWFGYGAGTTALLAALMVFFPLVITAALGFRGLDRDVLGAARVDGAGTWALLRHLEVPLALPQILAGLRASVALAMTGAVVGEFVVGGHGLGQLLTAQRDRVDTAAMFATLAVIAAVACAGYLLVRAVEGRAMEYVGQQRHQDQ